MVERDANFKLIKEIEKYPLLYNFNIAEYSNKIFVEKAWKEIADKTNISVADCKEKWRNVRSSFIRSKKPPRKGSRPKKPYYLACDLDFLLPFVKPRQSTADVGNISRLSQEDSEGNCQSQQLEEESEENSDSDTVLSSKSRRPKPTRKRPITEADNSLNQYQKKKNDSQKETQSTPTTSTTHPMQYFFLSILEEFDTMSENQTREFKIRVLQLIEEIKANASSTVTSWASFGPGGGKSEIP